MTDTTSTDHSTTFSYRPDESETAAYYAKVREDVGADAALYGPRMDYNDDGTWTVTITVVTDTVVVDRTALAVDFTLEYDRLVAGWSVPEDRYQAFKTAATLAAAGRVMTGADLQTMYDAADKVDAKHGVGVAS